MDSITLGAPCYLFTDGWTDAFLPLLENARKLGLECLDIAVGDDFSFDLNAVRVEAGNETDHFNQNVLLDTNYLVTEVIDDWSGILGLQNSGAFIKDGIPFIHSWFNEARPLH